MMEATLSKVPSDRVATIHHYRVHPLLQIDDRLVLLADEGNHEIGEQPLEGSLRRQVYHLLESVSPSRTAGNHSSQDMKVITSSLNDDGGSDSSGGVPDEEEEAGKALLRNLREMDRVEQCLMHQF